jgi:hypothetical protein
MESAWKHICTEPIALLSRRRTRMKRKEAFDGHIKRPLSAFILYGNSVRDQIRTKNPKMNMPDVSKEIGKGWRGLKDVEKATFDDQAKKDRERYDQERKGAYETAKAEGKLYKDTKPKRPLPSLAFFMKDEQVKSNLKPIFEEAKSKNNNAHWLSILKKAWDKIDDVERSKYQKLADADKIRYATEVALYEKRFKDYKEEDLPNQDFGDDDDVPVEEADPEDEEEANLEEEDEQ